MHERMLQRVEDLKPQSAGTGEPQVEAHLFQQITINITIKNEREHLILILIQMHTRILTRYTYIHIASQPASHDEMETLSVRQVKISRFDQTGSQSINESIHPSILRIEPCCLDLHPQTEQLSRTWFRRGRNRVRTKVKAKSRTGCQHGSRARQVYGTPPHHWPTRRGRSREPMILTMYRRNHGNCVTACVPEATSVVYGAVGAEGQSASLSLARSPRLARPGPAVPRLNASQRQVRLFSDDLDPRTARMCPYESTCLSMCVTSTLPSGSDRRGLDRKIFFAEFYLALFTVKSMRS